MQPACRRHRGTTPMGYLHQVRLARAHAELLATRPHQGVLIKDVAARRGWNNPGNFSLTYKQTYGRRPSSALDS
ncbi:helix-turn-helix domain-containing protein [Streptomyces rubiginosohelvolus]|uniref:helix-turn-helix domain-containing protein n=1 Tax=Streptomyces rubiginosohelvolus TaxID=67362 RepID=UPI0036DF289B